MKRKIKSEMDNIPVVILCGGRGTTVGSRGGLIPKPMIEIDGYPLLLHVMDHYGRFGFSRFIICTGYKGEFIKEFLSTIPFSGKVMDLKTAKGSPKPIIQSETTDLIDRTKWKITAIDTGIDNNTGSRVAQVQRRLSAAPFFCLTYGDTLCDVNLLDLISFHGNHGRIGTLLAVHPRTRFRILGLYGEDTSVRGFSDKPILQKEYINGGFYVFSKRLFDTELLTSDPACTLETDVLEKLVEMREMQAFKYSGYWQYVDTEKDLENLQLEIRGLRK